MAKKPKSNTPASIDWTKLTFDQTIDQVRRVLFWDMVDGIWVDWKMCLSREMFDNLMKRVSGAHLREVLHLEGRVFEAEHPSTMQLLELVVKLEQAEQMLKRADEANAKIVEYARSLEKKLKEAEHAE